MPLTDATDSPDKQLAARDELLQIMYWLRGEGLAKDVAAKDLTRWISLDPVQIHSLLVDLAEAKLVENIPSQQTNAARFQLTDSGVKEGGLRLHGCDLSRARVYRCSPCRPSACRTCPTRW